MCSHISFTPKTMEKTCSMPVINSFKIKLYFTVHYSTKLYSTVQYINIRRHIKFRNKFLGPKNHRKDM